MDVLIIGQNLTVARMLLNASKAHPEIHDARVIIFSEIEKLILTTIHGEPSEKIIVSHNSLQKDISSLGVQHGIEIKRGMNSVNFIGKRQRALFGTLEHLESFNFEQIWIFNEFTFIGRLLNAIPHLKSRTVIFENANVRAGVTVLGQFEGKNGSKLRGEILGPILDHPLCMSRIGKFYRYISASFQINEPKTLIYSMQRVFLRGLNRVVFVMLRKFSNLSQKLHNKNVILVALQIKHDSAVLMNTDYNGYCTLMEAAIKSHKASGKGDIIVVRPHPKDFTLGWLTFVRKAKKSFRKIYIDLDPIEDYQSRNVVSLVTYNSNVTRHPVWRTKPEMIVNVIGKASSLPDFETPLEVIFPGIFR